MCTDNAKMHLNLLYIHFVFVIKAFANVFLFFTLFCRAFIGHENSVCAAVIVLLNTVTLALSLKVWKQGHKYLQTGISMKYLNFFFFTWEYDNKMLLYALL